MNWTEYYSNPLILFNIMNSINVAGREISIFRTEEEMKSKDYNSQRIAFLHARNIEDLKKIAEKYHLYDNRTLYASTSEISWKVLGWTDFNKADWKKVSIKWNKLYDSAVLSQDFILDMDYTLGGDSFDKVVREMLQVHDFFLENDVAHSVTFSGAKGFHIRIDGREIELSLTRRVKPHDLVRHREAFYIKVAQGLKEELTLDTLDFSCLGRRQPVRVPYSLHANGQVCYPLSSLEIENLPKVASHGNLLAWSKPENVLRGLLYDKEAYKNRKGFNRGLPVFNGHTKSIKKIFGWLSSG